jgi:hypothetical protein
MLDGAPQFQSQQKQQLSQEEANDEVAVNGVGVGLLLAADQTETDERHGQENHAGHQTDVSDHIFDQRRLSGHCYEFLFVHDDGHRTQTGTGAIDVKVFLVVEPRVVEIGSATLSTPGAFDGYSGARY